MTERCESILSCSLGGKQVPTGSSQCELCVCARRIIVAEPGGESEQGLLGARVGPLTRELLDAGFIVTQLRLCEQRDAAQELVTQ